MVVNGEQIGEDLPKIEVINPATNEVVGTVPSGGEKEAELAIDERTMRFNHGRN